MLQRINVMNTKWLILLFLIGGSASLLCQVEPAAHSRSEVGAFASFGGLRTHEIAFTYNALGVDGGFFIQKSPLIGIEIRGGSYPFYARFPQAPITGGYRAAIQVTRFGDSEVFGYFGGGLSHSQNAGSHYVTTAAQWAPCWQASQGVNVPAGRHFQWKAYEVAWTETYSSIGNVHGYSLTTGVTYKF